MLPPEVDMTDKSALEQMKRINRPSLMVIEAFLTKKKFKDFFNKNVAAL